MTTLTYDYVVVGAGSAGCVIVARLTEDPSCPVLLLEGGGSDDHPDVSNPGRWPMLLSGPLDCYDEDRIDGRGEGQGPPWDCGHCKGVLAFDLATNSGFWLVHSVPLFPWPPAWQYRDGELMMGQTMLCITLADAETAQNIAQLMYDAHSPNVYLASDLLAKTTGQLYGFAPAEIPLTDVPTRLAPTDPRLQLMKNMNAAKNDRPRRTRARSASCRAADSP